VLIFPILKRHHEISAYGYLAAQVVQGLMLAVGITFLLLRIPLAQQYAGASHASVLPALARAAQEANHYSFWIGMLCVGIGGLLLCRVLLRERLVPAFMAVYGLAGYAVFLAGAMLEVLGHNVGVALSIPGGIGQNGDSQPGSKPRRRSTWRRQDAPQLPSGPSLPGSPAGCAPLLAARRSGLPGRLPVQYDRCWQGEE
jgi:hypothetical protein